MEICTSSSSKKAKLLHPRIAIEGSFHDLVTQSTIFADKSLLIKTIIEDSAKCLLLTMPRRWGKSTNLDMLKRFLEISDQTNGGALIPESREDTDNYKLFAGGQINDCFGRTVTLSPLKIADTILSDGTMALDVQGINPVIYIDFTNCVSTNPYGIDNQIRAALRDSFCQHAYLQDSPMIRRSSDLRKCFQQYIEKHRDADPEDGLKLLSELLYIHHKKKVWILIDNYDAAICEAYQDPETSTLKSMESTFSRLFKITLTSNVYLEKAVITGTQFLSKFRAGSGLNKSWKVDRTCPKYGPYYGLSQTEFETFCDHFGVPKKYLHAANQWYGGYSLQVYDHLTYKHMIDNKYNIWSVISYLKDGNYKHFKSYWDVSGIVECLPNLFSLYNSIRNKIEQLLEDDINGQSGTTVFEMEISFSYADFKTLKGMFYNNTIVGGGGVNLLFSYLYILGYLTTDGLNGDTYKLPNMEIKYELGKRLLKYYKAICTVDFEKLRSLTNTLQNGMTIIEPDQSRIKEFLKSFYNHFKEVIQSVRVVEGRNDNAVSPSEDTVQTIILNNIVLQTQHFAFGKEFYGITKLHSSIKGTVALKISNDNLVIIILVSWAPIPDSNDGHMLATLEQATRYRNSLQTNNKIFITVNIDQKIANHDERSIELLSVSDMFNKQHLFGINSMGKDDTFGVTSAFYLAANMH